MRIFLILFLFTLFGCGSEPEVIVEETEPLAEESKEEHQFPISVERGKF